MAVVPIATTPKSSGVRRRASTRLAPKPTTRLMTLEKVRKNTPASDRSLTSSAASVSTSSPRGGAVPPPRPRPRPAASPSASKCPSSGTTRALRPFFCAAAPHRARKFALRQRVVSSVSAASQSVTEVPVSNPHMLDLKPGELVRVRRRGDLRDAGRARDARRPAVHAGDAEVLRADAPGHAARGRDLRRRRARASHARHRAPAQHPLRRLLPWRLPGRVPDVLEGGLAGAGRGRRRGRAAGAGRARAGVCRRDAGPRHTRPREGEHGPDLYRCQATDIKQASRQLRLREVDQYKRGLRNWTLPKLFVGLFTEAINEWQAFSRNRLPNWTMDRPGGAVPVRARQAREGHDAQGRAAQPAAGRPGPGQEQARDRRHARQGQPQPRPELRSRDGEVLRPHRPRPHAESPG